MRHEDETEQLSKETGRSPPQSELLLSVSIDGVVTSHPLPHDGPISIGRADSNDICIAHASVSRAHAVVRISDRFDIEDLGSSNGTVVAGKPLLPNRPTTFAVGDLIRFGAIDGLLQYSLSSRTSRNIQRHVDGSNLELECVRSSQTGRAFALARLHIQSSGPDADEVLAHLQRHASGIAEAETANEYEVLLVEADFAQAQATLKQLTKQLQDAGCQVTFGLACYPTDGMKPEQLAARAWTNLRHAQGAVAKNQAMPQLRLLTEQVADSKLSVLIRGETGVGKEVCAETVHQLSARSHKPFLKLNCAALSPVLLESELFGHERGAFTGAVTTKLGLLETANGGTVFLDEVGELPPAVQAKLLRVLEDGSLLRVGGVTSIRLDVRFLAATNRNLEDDIKTRRFRADLYFRLSGVTLSIPTLKERVDEIEGLARAFCVSAARDRGGMLAPDISQHALSALLAYDWPGNIRELRNVIEQAVLVCGTGPIEREHLSFFARTDAAPTGSAAPTITAAASCKTAQRSLQGDVAELERARILRALDEYAGNQTRAAKALGIARGTLHARMDKYAIPRPRKRQK